MAFKIHFEDEIIPPEDVKVILDEIEYLIIEGYVPETDILYHDMGLVTGGEFNYIISSGTDESGIDTLFVQRYDPVSNKIKERPNE